VWRATFLRAIATSENLAVRKRLVKISFALFTFLVGASTFNLRHHSKPPLKFGPAEDPYESSLPVYKCDKTPDLPLPIKVLLNGNFPGWSFPEVSEDDCYSVRECGGLDAYAQMIKGDFNEDGLTDYAVLIQQSAEANDKGVARPLIVKIVAFFRKPGGYKMHQVSSEGGGSLILMPKGESDYDYGAQRDFTYPRDSIFSGMGMGGTSFIYENGRFRALTTSD
jgi:hypothetical protein